MKQIKDSPDNKDLMKLIDMEKKISYMDMMQKVYSDSKISDNEMMYKMVKKEEALKNQLDILNSKEDKHFNDTGKECIMRPGSCCGICSNQIIKFVAKNEGLIKTIMNNNNLENIRNDMKLDEKRKNKKIN